MKPPTPTLRRLENHCRKFTKLAVLFAALAFPLLELWRVFSFEHVSCNHAALHISSADEGNHPSFFKDTDGYICSKKFKTLTPTEKLMNREKLFFEGKLHAPMRLNVHPNGFQLDLNFKATSTDAIVYLAQKVHSTYGRNTFKNTLKSLELLYKNYKHVHAADIIILVEKGGFTADEFAVFKANGTRTNIKMYELSGRYWEETVHCIDPEEFGEPQYSLGYRRMIRLYSMGLFDLLPRLGYNWMMRMDEESFIHSNIDYNLFDFLRQKGAVYGYRIAVQEIAPEFYEHTRRFFQRYKVGSFDNVTKSYPDGITNYGIGIYNNFFVTDLSFWNRPEVLLFHDYLDASAGTFYFRWGDINSQSTALHAFADPETVYRFSDFTYEHSSLDKNGVVFWGGLHFGSNDKVRKVPDHLKNISRHGNCILVPAGNLNANDC